MNEAQKNAISEADNYLKAAGLPTYSSLTTSQPAPAVPDGFALVPVEPTKEMIDRACADHGYPGGNRWIYRDGYKSMLDAAQAKE